MSLSAAMPVVQGAILANYRDEEDRKKWTAELDRYLPCHKASKGELGRILKELKDIYCRPGCRGNWASFLRSRGIALRTAYDLIRTYLEGDSGLAGKNPRRHPVVSLRLPQEVAAQEEVKAAIAKLGREKAAEVMFAALIQAAAESDDGSPAEAPEPEPEPRTNFGKGQEYGPESGGSAAFEWRLESVGGKPMVWEAEVSEEILYESMACRNHEGEPESGESAELDWRVESVWGEPVSLLLYDLPERGRQLRIRRIRHIQSVN